MCENDHPIGPRSLLSGLVAARLASEPGLTSRQIEAT
jgi:hypothetical protein